LKTDRYIKDISDRLNDISNGNGSSDDDNYGLDKYDDEYYLDAGRTPPRLTYYRIARGDDHHSVTHEELDYRLKQKLRMTPEQRYQREKANFLFHDLSCYMRKLCEEDYGCNGSGCIPECRFYPEYGRIEDQEVLDEHNKLVESLRQENAIVEPPPQSELLRLAKIYHF
jgi:hypothetical protein